MKWVRGPSLRGPIGQTPKVGVDFPHPKNGYTPVKYKDYFDGKDAVVNEDRIVQMVLNRIPPPIPGENSTFDEEELFKSFLEKIKKGQLLDISNIRNASTFMKDGIRYKIEELMHGSGSSSDAVTMNTVTQYNLSSKTQVGANVVIPLSQLTNFSTLVNIVTVYRNQIAQTEGITFTATATDITVLGASTNNTFSISYTYSS